MKRVFCSKTIYTSRFSPESSINQEMIRQVFWLTPLFIAFPSFLDSGMRTNNLTELTATGIAPDLHRLPF